MSVYKHNNIYICECGKEFEKSQSLNAHFARCLTHRNGNAIIKRNHGGGWNKGLNKDTNEIIAKQAILLSELKKGHKVSDKTKKLLSERRIEYLESNPHVKWYTVNNGIKDIKVQGNWEKTVAEWLNSLDIKWDRKRISYDKTRTYTPDFWLPDYNFYIEVKGWFRDYDIK